METGLTASAKGFGRRESTRGAKERLGRHGRQMSKNSSTRRENNFDILRLVLAIVVVFFHAGSISGSPELAWLSDVFSGHLAVEGFFAISGFLIFASYERSQSLKDYFLRRAGRILPGYWLATIFCLGIAFSAGCFHVGKF